MCELLALYFNLPVSPRISFKGFKVRGKHNPHGWGLAFYPDNSAIVFKEPLTATESRLASFIENYELIKSRIFIGHVRYAIRGEASYRNTHPFKRELFGKDYVFAHNGTLHGYRELELGRFEPVGETDSEYLFCYLLSQIEERGIVEWRRSDFDWLAGLLAEVNNYGYLNCIFSDGEYLFCYYDKTGYNGLCLLHRKPPYGRIKVKLADRDWEVNLVFEKDSREQGYVVATRPLTNEMWECFLPGELIVFKNGEIVYSNKRRPEEIEPKVPSGIELEILRVVRRAPHRVSLREIALKLNLPLEEVRKSVFSLLCKGYLRQDKRDRVKWHNPEATFFTNKSRRKEIDKLLKREET
ncbi:MAG: class II glutamine amidotransferase [Thermoprotei archaeon]|nr:MAG: class II glutamine amidotransferase [Thermoprotei archaeon]